jgi:sterol desaturase/sphingolipid hydroxylase (fatty acid hydroxylase superfamily)
MTDSVLLYERWIRLGFFAVTFLVMATWELALPRRRLETSKLRRWLRNLGVVLLDTLTVRVLFPTAAVGFAWLASARGWGLLHGAALPYWLAFGLSFVALDFIVYLQHVLFHAVPALWRLHMVHHADLDFDLTTGNRFHPIEIVLSMFVKGAAIAALGPPVLSVLAFEVILNATAMFNHANVKMPLAADRALRYLVVTPDMHRVHHSILPFETNSNFGFNLPWWDRLLGTYREEPRAGHAEMKIGLRQFRDADQLTLQRMLVLPFVGDIGAYSFGSRSGREGLRRRGPAEG